MGRIKSFKISKFIYYLTIACLSVGVIFFTYRLVKGDPVNIAKFIDNIRKYRYLDEHKGDFVKKKEQLDKNNQDKGDNSGGEKTKKDENYFKDILSRIGIENIKDPKTLFMYQMPFIRGIDNSMSRGGSREKKMPPSSETEDSKQVMAESDAEFDDSDEIEAILKDDPEIPDDIKIVIEKIEDDLGPIELTGDGPQILIYHSHSREAYRQDPNRRYTESAKEAFRSDDLNSTVVRVGDVLAHHLKELGIPVFHDRTEHEQDNYNKSYVRSLETLKKRMQEYSSLKIFIDIHRNAYKEGVKTPDEEVIVVDGERIAKMSVVIGTGKGELGGFREKPNWQENYKFALKLTNKVNEICPGLAKPVMVQNGRYNQHVSTNAILIEVGSTLTTLEEAERTAKYLAKALSEIVE